MIRHFTHTAFPFMEYALIEPLETREVHRIEQFVIVIDTSMSCSGELVQWFLEETYDVLSQSETYFRKVQIHVIQCDDKVQSDVVLTSHGACMLSTGTPLSITFMS